MNSTHEHILWHGVMTNKSVNIRTNWCCGLEMEPSLHELRGFGQHFPKWCKRHRRNVWRGKNKIRMFKNYFVFLSSYLIFATDLLSLTVRSAASHNMYSALLRCFYTSHFFRLVCPLAVFCARKMRSLQ